MTQQAAMPAALQELQPARSAVAESAPRHAPHMDAADTDPCSLDPDNAAQAAVPRSVPVPLAVDPESATAPGSSGQDPADVPGATAQPAGATSVSPAATAGFQHVGPTPKELRKAQRRLEHATTQLSKFPRCEPAPVQGRGRSGGWHRGTGGGMRVLGRPGMAAKGVGSVPGVVMSAPGHALAQRRWQRQAQMGPAQGFVVQSFVAQAPPPTGPSTLPYRGPSPTTDTCMLTCHLQLPYSLSPQPPRTCPHATGTAPTTMRWRSRTCVARSSSPRGTPSSGLRRPSRGRCRASLA